MKKVALAGLINIETTVAIDKFPIEYAPIDYRFFGVETTVSGVGYNVSKALKTLGDEVDIFSIIGKDIYKAVIKEEFTREEIDPSYVIDSIDEIPQSVIFYDKDGRRKINLDLKDIQDAEYPAENIEKALTRADVVIPCNINFARPILRKAKEMNQVIATDVHVIGDVKDAYNREFMALSDILFFSNEKIIGKEYAFLDQIIKQYDHKIIVVGLGEKGALLYVREDDKIKEYPAVNTREIVSTIGAGDSLFASFIHFYINGHSPYDALQNAIVFASYKIGEKGASKGFLTERQLMEWKKKTHQADGEEYFLR